MPVSSSGFRSARAATTSRAGSPTSGSCVSAQRVVPGHLPVRPGRRQRRRAQLGDDRRCGRQRRRSRTCTFFSPEGRRPTDDDCAPRCRARPTINLDPVVVASSVALAAGVVVVVPFPAALFNIDAGAELRRGQLVLEARGRPLRAGINLGATSGANGRIRSRSAERDPRTCLRRLPALAPRRWRRRATG